MVQKFFKVAWVAMLFGCHQPHAQPPEFTSEQLQTDLDQLVYELRTYNPGLYWYQTPEEFERQVIQAETAIQVGQNFADFYKTVNQLTSSIGCGHTRIRMPMQRAEQLIDTTLVLPLPVFLIDDAIFTTKAVAGIPAGSRIISIGEHQSDEILVKLRSVVPSDGYNLTGKDHFIGPGFGLMLALYLGIEGPTIAVSYFPPGTKTSKTQIVTLEPASPVITADQRPLMSFTDAEIPNTKILRVGIFSSGMLNNAGFDYFEFLEDTFSQLKASQTENLIIDVRGNGGGDDHYGATLVSYIAGQSFGYFDNIKVTKAYNGYGEIEETAAGQRLMLSHQDLQKHLPAASKFIGKVFILADGGSFSTTADFVSISKNIGAATVVGQETGGGACGNTSGHNKTITLKNSGISVQIQMWGYSSTVDPNLPCGWGVIPDYKVVDLPFTRQDEVLEVVSQLIGK